MARFVQVEKVDGDFIIVNVDNVLYLGEADEEGQTLLVFAVHEIDGKAVDTGITVSGTPEAVLASMAGKVKRV